MSRKNWSNILSVLARILLVFVFVSGQTAWAMQVQNATDKSSSSKAAKTNQAPTNGSTAAGAKAQSGKEETAWEENSSNREDSRHDGQHEGIKVHGHWTIEVRNPDGSMTRHLEFENALDPGFTASNSGGQSIVVPGGAAYLSGLLSGQWSGPGNNAAPFLEIYLVGPAGLNSLASNSNAPCTQGGEFPGACIIAPGYGGVQGAGGAGLSNDLSITPLGAPPAFTGLRLTGDVGATQNGQISMVLTIVYSLSCTASFPNCGAPRIASLTSSTNFPGAPISVSAGQTIAVTVNISFS